MILYLDTSALVKAYVNENSSADVLDLMKKAKVVASHYIAFVEAHSAFSRIKREEKIKVEIYEVIRNSFNKDWENYLRIDSNQPLMQRAADFSEAFALRAYDSVHLAAADFLFKQTRDEVMFFCFDHQLNKAAHVLGLSVVNTF